MEKKLVSMFLSVVICLSLMGCGSENFKTTKKETAKEVYTYSVEGLETGEMPIMGFGTVYDGNYLKDGYVYPSIFKEETFKKISDSGVNTIVVAGYDLAKQEEDKNLSDMLEWGDKNNLHYLLPDTGIFTMKGNDASKFTIGGETSVTDENKPIIEQRIAERVASYANHKSIAGLYVRDEPTKNLYDHIGKVNTFFKKANQDAGKNYITYNNMFPPTSTTQLLGTAPMPDGGYPYTSYVDDMANSNPTFLMYDSYPFEKTEREISDAWFNTMSTIRQKSEQHKLPWTLWIQTGGNFEDAKQLRVNTEGEFLWAINAGLAFGAKGVGYFPLVVPDYYVSGVTGSYESSLINESGNATPYYYYAKKANKQIKAIDEILMQSSNQGIIYTGVGCISNASVGAITQKKFRQLTSVSGDASIVGCFDYKGGTALYVVNNQPKKSRASVTLNFDNTYCYDVIQRGNIASIAGNTLELTLDAGEGALVSLR